MQKAENGQRDNSMEKQKLEIAALLIQHNIQTELRNNEGKTPLEEATSVSLKEKVETLIQEKLYVQLNLTNLSITHHFILLFIFPYSSFLGMPPIEW
jgi:hypothetical protein